MTFRKFFKGIKKGQKEYGDTIAALVNSILLSVVYLIGIGITSIFSKIFKKKFLDLDIEEKKKTYWEDLNLARSPLKTYYRQF